MFYLVEKRRPFYFVPSLILLPTAARAFWFATQYRGGRATPGNRGNGYLQAFCNFFNSWQFRWHNKYKLCRKITQTFAIVFQTFA